MQHVYFLICSIAIASAISCSESTEPIDMSAAIYLPPSQGEWEKVDPITLGWHSSGISALVRWIDQSDTRALIILKDGKIAIEKYAGKDLLGLRSFDQKQTWYWASAGKVLTSSMIGILRADGLIDFDHSSRRYLGNNWSTVSDDQENDITVRDHLAMTTGLDDKGPNCLEAACFTYKSPAGERWAYHNPPYTILSEMVAKVSGQSFSNFFNGRIASAIGMTGRWQAVDNNVVYFSTARDMARFGLLVLNEGKWLNQQEIIDAQYLRAATASSQTINPSYGYLWWLNGKSSFMLPQSQVTFSGSLVPSAPNDMVAALGKGGQMCMVIPSTKMVIIRMGNSGREDQVSINIMRDLWDILAQTL